MFRILASLLIAIGLAFAPALMAQAVAAPAPAMEHCAGALPAKQQGKADAKPCCTTACLSTAALPDAPRIHKLAQPSAPPNMSSALGIAGLHPESATPPPRATA